MTGGRGAGRVFLSFFRVLKVDDCPAIVELAGDVGGLATVVRGVCVW
jgi:hypothetical protein